LTPSPPVLSLIAVDVPLNSDLQAKLNRLAALQGRASEALVVEAIERLVNYDEWFLREVHRGLAEADRGELVDHSDVRKMIDERYPG
jgi:RHH-type rel operon transcriptional repressor/antitoxin RelB